MADGPAGTPNADWRASLPEDLRANESLKPFETVADLAKAHLDTTSKLTDAETRLNDYIPKLPDDASDEDRNLYYQALGRPEKSDEYEFDQEDKNAKEWTGYWKQQFHSLGFTKDQAKRLSGLWNAQMQKMVEAHNAQVQNEVKTSEAKLKTELGDKYETSVELAKRLYQKHLGTEFDKNFAAGSPGNRFDTIRLLLKLAALTGEDRSPQGSQRPNGKAETFISYDKSPAPPQRG